MLLFLVIVVVLGLVVMRKLILYSKKQEKIINKIYYDKFIEILEKPQPVKSDFDYDCDFDEIIKAWREEQWNIFSEVFS